MNIYKYKKNISKFTKNNQMKMEFSSIYEWK